MRRSGSCRRVFAAGRKTVFGHVATRISPSMNTSRPLPPSAAPERRRAPSRMSVPFAPRRALGPLVALVLAAPVFAADTVPAISAAWLLERTKVLASDEFEGRAPGSAGEEKTVNYLIN